MLSRHAAVLTAVIAAAANLAAIPVAQAQWTQDGARIYGAFGGQMQVSDAQAYGLGGVVALVPYEYALDIRWIDGDGIARWNTAPANDPFIYPGPNSYSFSGAAMAAMPNNDVYVGWNELEYNAELFQYVGVARVQRLDANKSVQWAPEGVRAFPNVGGYTTGTAVCAGASGDVMVATVEFDSVLSIPRRLRMQRLLADSTRAWGPAGLVLDPTRDLVGFSPLAMRPDGAGGVYILWPESGIVLGEWDYRVQHVSAAGVAQWTSGGVLATTLPGSSPLGTLLLDGAGGVYLTVKASSGVGAIVQAQRLDASGARLYGTNGVELAGPVSATHPYQSAVDADAQGLRLAWSELGTQLHCRRYDAADGSPLAMSPMLNQPFVGNSVVGLQVLACANGEATVAWAFDGTGGRVMAQRVSASGAILWNQGGIAVSAPPTEVPSALFMTPDGSDGVYCMFQRVGVSSGGWYAMRVDADGDLRMLSGTITAAADIPADQGGSLALTYRSPITDAGLNLPEVTGYNVWRLTTGLLATEAAVLEPVSEEDALAALASSTDVRLKLTPALALRLRFPPGTWESLGFHAAVLDSQYRFVVPTLNDSGPATPNADETFVVTAHTSSPSTFGISNPMTAHSRDNLAPAAPQALAGAFSAGSLSLTWAPNGENDLSGYRVYRGSTAGFVPSAMTLLGSAGAAGFVDGAFASGQWYKVTALDRHGNESTVAVLAPSAVTDTDLQPTAHVDFLRTTGANPVRGGLAVEFGLRAAGHARVTVLDAQGRVAAVLADGRFEAGAHRVAWTRRGARAGLYFVRIEAAGFVSARKVVLAD